MSERVVIGMDAGGTSTRCVVATLDGAVLGYGRAGGANQFSSPDPAAAFEAALRDALGCVAGGAGGVRVVGAVFGVAGASEAGRDRAERDAGAAWRAVGLPGAPEVTDDIAVAFAAGTAAAEGAVLIAGTGSVAAHVRDGSVLRRCDGYGWLLGDEGSAVWIALEGLRAVLAALDGRGRPTTLCDWLPAALGIPTGKAQPIIRAVHARPPAELGELAPVVTGAAGEGDAVAGGIVAEAARRLLTNLAVVAPTPDTATPVVLAGSVLTEGPVATAVREGVRERYGAPALAAGEGALGAAGLALRAAGAASAHATLLTGEDHPAAG